MEKVIKRKGDKLYVKQKVYDKSFNSGIHKKDNCFIKMRYFPPYNHSKIKIEVKLDFVLLCNKVLLKKRNMC